jgi:hypothetical protein
MKHWPPVKIHHINEDFVIEVDVILKGKFKALRGRSLDLAVVAEAVDEF